MCLTSYHILLFCEICDFLMQNLRENKTILIKIITEKCYAQIISTFWLKTQNKKNVFALVLCLCGKKNLLLLNENTENHFNCDVSHLWIVEDNNFALLVNFRIFLLTVVFFIRVSHLFHFIRFQWMQIFWHSQIFKKRLNLFYNQNKLFQWKLN